MIQRLQIHPEVMQALRDAQPVVALESTIISHGMPYPRNVETALAVEEAVRREGAVPATIGIRDGFCKVGMDSDEIEHFGAAKQVWKVSIRDMPYVLSQRLSGATTVAATLRIAAMAGIRFFVTGGIGGVHRGATTTMDISADLPELANSSAAVISAGMKSILDIPLTLEYLETAGVPVVTIGQDNLPGFYSKDSGYPSPLRLDSHSQIARLLHCKWGMGLEGAVLVANPVPAEWDIPAPEMEAHIQRAMEAADNAGVSGKELTPFLLKQIADNSRGESLAANIALVKHNATTGAAIAVAYYQNDPHQADA